MHALEHFQAKRGAVRRRKCDKAHKARARSASSETERALATKYAAAFEPRKYAGAMIAALFIALAISAWAKLAMVPIRAVDVEDRFRPGVKLGGGLYEEPLLF